MKPTCIESLHTEPESVDTKKDQRSHIIMSRVKLSREWFATSLCCMTLLMSACNSALEPLNALTSSSAYDRRANLVYGDDPRQRMDLYRARKRGDNTSTIVFVYGGAWRDGQRKDYAFMAQSLASHGHDVLIPDYRLHPDVTWPAFIEDVADAIKLLDTHAQEWLDRPLQRLVLMGHSSGAHTAAVLAGNADRWLDNVGAEVVGLIGLAGPYDLPLDDPEVAPVFPILEDPISAIPVASVNEFHPPTLLIHGTSDTRVRPFHTENMATALQQHAVKVDVEKLDGTGHGLAVANFAAPLDLFSDEPETVKAWLSALDAATP